ncbi:hypothetical protein JHW43_002687 [Diplocarpon mali]|nr:hypothetical protein JHW43_002687 [Diplocarpon mali]
MPVASRTMRFYLVPLGFVCPTYIELFLRTRFSVRPTPPVHHLRRSKSTPVWRSTIIVSVDPLPQHDSFTMVILGGLELVAAGYLIHKHCQNKEAKQRLEAAAAALEEQQYRIFPPDEHGRPSQSHHHRRRSPSHRRHSTDGQHRGEESARPPSCHGGPAPTPKALPRPNSPRRPLQQANAPLQPQPRWRQPDSPAPQQSPYPPDIKYGWMDDEESARPPRQPDQSDPPVGRPLHWEPTRVASTPRAESPRGRQDSSDSALVEYGSRHTPSSRAASRSPPPVHRA